MPNRKPSSRKSRKKNAQQHHHGKTISSSADAVPADSDHMKATGENVKVREENKETSSSSSPTCWICLEESEDHRPLRRDCACRGDSAGFAHLDCLVEYCSRKENDFVEEWEEWDADEYVDADLDLLLVVQDCWKACPNCTHEFGRELMLALQ